MTFAELQLSDSLKRAVAAEGYTTPTPIQEQAIPHVLAGRDLLGVAQTGTGKTAAFALPTLHRLSTSSPRGPGKHVRCLVLTPTRELAAQVDESFRVYGRQLTLRSTVIFGGVGQTAQVAELRRGVDVLVATPGRLLDLCQQGLVSLKHVEVYVLDEADRMLDMGFLPDVRRITAMLPKERQTLFFSATMPPDITDLAKKILIDPVRVEVTPVSSTAERVEQHVYFVRKDDKRDLLVELLQDPAVKRTLVFTRTKHGADRVAKALIKAGIRADAIHGNKSQNARERALDGFRDGKLPVLVATDIAARGIDVEGVTHVVNFELPNVPEQYVHRIGRTGRAGAAGIALSFCDAEERPYLRDIEKTIRQAVPVREHSYPASPRMEARMESSGGGQRQGGRPQGRGGGGGGRSGGGQRRGGRPGSASSGGGQRSASRSHA
ncbi:MAG: DEAD/DEAH box helicase, partial [Myxococcota bacterium]|nr:DEAD/DEAH box helicase [Myxococcota bacterium]